MTDAPEGQAGAQPERGSGRRSQRVGDSGSPVGSTLSIVLAVVAVIAGFLILRAITDDDDGDADDSLVVGTDDPDSSDAPSATSGADSTTPGVVTTTTIGRTVSGATVVVANASGVGGSAAAMTTALEGAGFTLGAPGNTTLEQLDTSVVYYVVGDVAAQAVATTVAGDLGGLAVAEMPSPPPIDVGLGTSTVLVMVGTDTAQQTLADLNPAVVPAPDVAGQTTTTAAGA